MLLSAQESELCKSLRALPKAHDYQYNEDAAKHLKRILFQFLAGHNEQYLQLLFSAIPPPDTAWNLRRAQGAVEGAEYTAAARGHPCGHIFRNGETTYRCRTCSSDDTCVLCARCFEATDHEGHNIFVSVSPGNSGCCDCGDPEAWLREVKCSIHSASAIPQSQNTVKSSDTFQLPLDLVASITMTISRTMDYVCDVFSCSPEQMRLAKSEDSVRKDERFSRLPAKVYSSSEDQDDSQDFALVLWNDEKHTVNNVRDQVSRACKISPREAYRKAIEVDAVGRSIVVIKKDLPALLEAAKVIEQPKLTVTIRSARDTFREQMCATIIEWISDIAGCSVGSDHNILRETICEQFLRPWRVGSEAHHQEVGKDGLDDHEVEDYPFEYFKFHGRFPVHVANRYNRAWGEGEDEDSQEDDDEEDEVDDHDDSMDVDDPDWSGSQGQEMDIDTESSPLENSEATLAGYPPPPPPPRPRPRRRIQDATVASSVDEGDSSLMPLTIPRTPKANTRTLRRARLPKYWLEKPAAYRKLRDLPPGEDLSSRVRLDYLILYDLRMWKKLRTDLRDVLITTVVTLPRFKRLLGLRFAGVYTVLAELYLIADREPDHSIINLSLQMLTTPSITAEIVERGNFLANITAIIYTFLTTRQVGYPSDVNLTATLAFEQGAVTNRRTYHFYMDLKYLMQSELVQERLRSEERYLLQFLDLAKLHQGLCPNIRAVGEHVEFENDTWLSASIIIQEIIKLCRLVGECYSVRTEQDFADLCKGIRNAAQVAITHCLGSERKRFDQAEIKGETRFKVLPTFEFENSATELVPPHRVVDFVVATEHVSFHHALHYTLSWLIDRGKTMSKEQLQKLLLFSTQELRQSPGPTKAQIPELQPMDSLLALFDFPLRVTAWLAQMRAGMWVRNGITLRHQMIAYRGHPRRELSYQRDIFMLQTAMVVLPPAQFLASMVDRFDLTDWIQNSHLLRNGQDEQQKLDVAEDFVHLLIILLSDRIHLRPTESEEEPQLSLARRDIIHNLCFKPLSFSSLCHHIPDKFSDTDHFDKLIEEMTVFKAPESISDHGTYSLKEEFHDQIDPYLSNFSRNQRDEAENIYKKHMAKKLGKDPADIVYEPKLLPLGTGLFKDISNFTRLPLFAQIIFYLLQYAVVTDRISDHVPGTKVEQFLHFILHLTLIAVLEDLESDKQINGDVSSFCRLAITKRAKHPISGCDTIALLLRRISDMDTFKSCEPKVKLILRHMRHKRPKEYLSWMHSMDLPVDRSENASPAPGALDKELKKKQALDRQAKIMAQMKQQQNSFMQNQSIDWGEDDFSDLEEDFSTPAEEQQRVWNYPSGTCILCQEETNDQKLYGTFALINESRILRQTDAGDPEWVAEAIHTPHSLDRSADDVRPFGVAGNNKKRIVKTLADGNFVENERVDLAKGFPMKEFSTRGPVATGCGHIMHYSCFEVYVQATNRRQMAAIARKHPERLDKKEFLCPLCKALGNTFLPIVWKGKQLNYPGVLRSDTSFDEFLQHTIGSQLAKVEESPKSPEQEVAGITRSLETLFMDYGKRELINTLASGLHDLARTYQPPTQSSLATPLSRHRQFQTSISSLFSVQPDENITIPSSIILSGMAGVAGESSRTTVLTPQLAELLRVYQRLRDTMSLNDLPSRHQYSGVVVDDLVYSDTLASSLGYSISAAEIAQRGVQSDLGATFLDKLSSQTLTHLRVLSETILSYYAVGALKNGGDNSTRPEFLRAYSTQLHSLFVGHPQVCGLADLEDSPEARRTRPPLLSQDSFIFLSECVAVLQPALQLDVGHVIRLCYTAEIVRVITAFMLPNAHPPPYEYIDAYQVPSSAQAFVELVLHVHGQLQRHPGGLQERLLNTDELKLYVVQLYRLARAYALPFLRKCVLLMHARFGIEYSVENIGHDDEELIRLSRALQLPSFDDMITEAMNQSSLTFITGWLRHWSLYSEMNKASQQDHGQSPSELVSSGIRLSHPAIFELVGLPKNFDTLQDISMRKKCPTTGKEVTDPVVCLFCGDIFCSQAVCCQDADHKGGCWQHRQDCGGPIGLFINIRKCMVLLLNGENGMWSSAPYLDKHGETDGTLRRHHQLFLHQRRYDKLLRDVWLAHGVPSGIARRLEGDSNNGGWETL